MEKEIWIKMNLRNILSQISVLASTLHLTVLERNYTKIVICMHRSLFFPKVFGTFQAVCDILGHVSFGFGVMI